MTDLVPSTVTGIVPVTEEIKNFSKGSNKQIQFVIDDDTFYAPARVPAQTLIDFTKMFDGLTGNTDTQKTIDAFMATIKLVLLPDSAELFLQRMRDMENPIDMEQVNEVIPWLMEKYGLRPTQPSENSSDGQPGQESGTPSTETQPVEESISSPSLPIDS